MADHIRLYSRPLVMDDVAAALSVTGELPDYTLGDAFEGRLDINNPIGRCTVELMPDSVLPPGVTVRVDNITREVVLKWGSFRVVNPVENAPVINGDFEDGDDGTWTNQQEGWSIVDGRGKGGSRAAEFGSKRGINNYIGALVPVTDINKIVKLEASINHGSASTGELVAGPYLLWYDINRVLVRWTNPVTYVRGGANGDWHDYSYAEGAAADASIRYVAPGLTANRKSSRHSLWVDDVRWNHAYTVGSNTYEDYRVHLKVTDSQNRVAYWVGGIWWNSSWWSGAPASQFFGNSLQISPQFVSASTAEGLSTYTQPHESLIVSPGFLSASTKSLQWEHVQPPEGLSMEPGFVSASTKATQWSLTLATQHIVIAPSSVSASTKNVLRTQTVPVMGLVINPGFVGASTSAG